jgi:CheY-like chemotaxis protein
MSLRILIVEDDPLTVRLMRAAVVPLGHKVLTIEDGRNAAAQVETQKFDLLFVSLGLAEPGGLELTRQTRRSNLNRDVAIVALSPTNSVKTVRNAFRAGATLVLTKPLARAHLVPILTAMDRPGWKDQRHAARMPLFAPVNCEWNNQQFALCSLNISESGMLLEPAIDAEIGQELGLQFEIGEAQTALHARARIVRKEGGERMGVEFTGLAPEDKNAIQLHILGRLRGPTRASKPLRVKLPRLFPRNG